MKQRDLAAWSRFPVPGRQQLIRLQDRNAPLPELQGPYLPRGNGRSYSDVCLNDGGVLLDTRWLDKFISFDRHSGRLCCEAGVLLDDIIRVAAPRGWFLPVTPGTRFVTLGGAIANDVHGKNHHVAGSFGRYVTRLALRRSDGTELVCGPELDQGWFAATVGGLGLTGVIMWAELQLVPLESDAIVMAARRFDSIEAFWDLNEAASAEWPYTVAWVDCMTRAGGSVGRGVLLCGRHASRGSAAVEAPGKPRRVALDPPFSLVRRLSARLFNEAYFRGHRSGRTASRHYLPFFYPLDGVLDWNRLYGRPGFYQYQCVLPPPAARDLMPALLRRIAASGEVAFLGVLKTFGSVPNAGLLSFPRPGVTLAVDFPNRGQRTTRLLAELDAIVLEADGALYPAKDSRMPAHMFRAGFRALDEFSRYVDPAACSDFWRRVTAGGRRREA